MDHPTTSDNDTALHIAMEVFQRQGFEATSMSDLVAATGMNRASLYSTFGSKHQLYLAALTYWRNRSEAQAHAVMGADDAFFDMLANVLKVVARQAREGNLMVSAAVELAAGDPLTSRRVRETWTKSEADLKRVLHQAKATGQLSASVDVEQLARTILVFLQGMYVVGRVEEEEGWVASAAQGIQALLKGA
ncbi:TetR/AcrR family transcriptional regulator [Natronoglycomyces albus]|uniref:Helix-turn-helix transcriptional regulator n=1 Tax=Natronoglycomyces albus TaxID=2811108 RepID=A0A895XPM2_9ACTN|nr:TetR/AcrR family transcriptional regulator [Natronoglycomyces albus]QSB05493.1 helix-turn-helix transcriptional regulator [Natronoglycomyces albus]